MPTENPPANGYAPCVELLVSTLGRTPGLRTRPGLLEIGSTLEFVKISRMVECAKIHALTAARLLA